MTHKGWCVVKHQTNKQTNQTVSALALRAPADTVYSGWDQAGIKNTL